MRSPLSFPRCPGKAVSTGERGRGMGEVGRLRGAAPLRTNARRVGTAGRVTSQNRTSYLNYGALGRYTLT